MNRAAAIVGSLIFFALAPGVVAGIVPWLLTNWDAQSTWPPARILGALMIILGVAVLLDAFVRFAIDGLGTPAPVAETESLVVAGPYAWVRNPMYLAVAAVIVGQALVLGRGVLLVYAAAFGVAVTAFVRGYEEPRLAARFGADYEQYRRGVPRWRPRLRAWTPPRVEGPVERAIDR